MTSETAGKGPKKAGRARARRGRVEVGLENELVTRRDIGKAARAALRAQARAVDAAELQRDPDAVSTANRVYLDALAAYGLGPPIVEAEGDAFERLLAELGRPETTTGHAPDAGPA